MIIYFLLLGKAETRPIFGIQKVELTAQKWLETWNCIILHIPSLPIMYVVLNDCVWWQHTPHGWVVLALELKSYHSVCGWKTNKKECWPSEFLVFPQFPPQDFHHGGVVSFSGTSMMNLIFSDEVDTWWKSWKSTWQTQCIGKTQWLVWKERKNKNKMMSTFCKTLKKIGTCHKGIHPSNQYKQRLRY